MMFEFLGLPEDQWRFINTFAPWLSAFGTLSAVIVSLFLASKRNIKLKIRVGYRELATIEETGPLPAYVVIEIVNVGDREATITSIGWKVGLRKPKYSIQLFNHDDRLTSQIPSTIKHGEVARFFISLNESGWLDRFAKDYLSSWPTLESKFIKLNVGLSIGTVINVSIEEGLRQKLILAFQNLQTKAVN